MTVSDLGNFPNLNVKDYKMDNMQNIANNMGEAIKNFRSAAVTAENKATPMARSILAALMTGTTSADGVVAAVIASFGNPKSPKTGKPVDKLSGLRDFVGGDATRKTVESILRIHDNIRSVPELKALATAFILETANCPKSLRALDVAVKEALRAAAAKDTPPEGPAETNVDAPTDGGAAVVSTLADRLNKLALEIAGLSDDDFLAVSAETAALRKAIADRTNAFTAAKIEERKVA